MKVIVIVNAIYGGQAPFFEGDAFWIIGSPNNRALAQSLKQNGQYCIELPLENIDTAPWILAKEIYIMINQKFPQWDSIDYIGMKPMISIMSEFLVSNGIRSELHIMPLHDECAIPLEAMSGFRVSKNPQQMPEALIQDHTQGPSFLNVSKITDRALARIAEFTKFACSQQPEEDLVPTLTWGLRGHKESDVGRWHDFDAGFTLGFFFSGSMPPVHIEPQGIIGLVLQRGLDDKIMLGKKVDYNKENGGFILINE